MAPDVITGREMVIKDGCLKSVIPSDYDKLFPIKTDRFKQNSHLARELRLGLVPAPPNPPPPLPFSSPPALPALRHCTNLILITH